MAKSNLLSILDLRGGINDGDAPAMIDDNQAAVMTDVDFRSGRLGSKRGGATGIGLVGSVFERALPIVRATGQNGASGVTTLDTVVPNAVGAISSANLLLIAFFSTLGTISGTPTFAAANLTLLNSFTQSGQTIYIYYMRNPGTAGGTVHVATTGATSIACIAQYVDNAETASSPNNFFSAGNAGIGTVTQDISSAAFTPTSLVMCACSPGSGGTTITANFANGEVSQVTQTAGLGYAVLLSDRIGAKPKTQFEFFMSAGPTVAAGCGVLGVKNTTSQWGNETLRAIMRHTPTNNIADDEIWIQDDWGRLDRRVNQVWQGGVPVQNFQVGTTIDAPNDTTSWCTNGASLHKKFFLALDGVKFSQTRLHVWDGTVLRWAGLLPPTLSPSVADTVGAGTFSGKRWYRIRHIASVGGVIQRRSEPTPSVAFTPSGANVSATITYVPAPSFGPFDEGQTHWELEASTDNTTFFLIATTAVGVTTAVDANAYNAGSPASTYSAFPLSASLTEYTVPNAARHVVVDGDRLLMGGLPQVTASFFNYNPDLDSRISWTPLGADNGVGNDERIPATARFFQDLDGTVGGQVTHLLPSSMGGVFVLKRSRIYKLARSGSTPAYEQILYSETRGSVMRGAANGTDAKGNPCAYFVDGSVGPCALTTNGVQDLMQIRNTMAARLNENAQVVARVLFYPKHWLVWFSVALDANSKPSYLWCFNARQGSWTDYTGIAAKFVSGITFPDQTGTDAKLQPLIIPVAKNNFNLLRADNSQQDDGVNVVPVITSKAYAIGEHFYESSVNGAVLHALATNAVIVVTAIRDLGLSSKACQGLNLVPVAGETYVTRGADDFVIGECHQVQVSLTEGVPGTTTFVLEGFVTRPLLQTPQGS